MKTIRINFIDFYTPYLSKIALCQKILTILKTKYNVIVDQVNPDYVFYSVFANEHLKYQDKVLIFYTGECVSINFEECDYALGFDFINFEDRYLRYPVYMERYNVNNVPECANKKFFNYSDYLFKLGENNSRYLTHKKNKFCSFVVFNFNYAIKKREEFFDLLSKYKKVDSGGLFKLNIKEKIGPNVEDKINFLKDYKFNICFENNIYNGYTTEKILDAFEAGCIPIYLGDPKIGEQFNEKAFINCAKFKNFEEVIDKIKEIDNNDELRLQMLKEPILIKPIEDNLSSFLYNIFDKDLSIAKRRPLLKRIQLKQ